MFIVRFFKLMIKVPLFYITSISQAGAGIPSNLFVCPNYTQISAQQKPQFNDLNGL